MSETSFRVTPIQQPAKESRRTAQKSFVQCQRNEREREVVGYSKSHVFIVPMLLKIDSDAHTHIYHHGIANEIMPINLLAGTPSICRSWATTFISALIIFSRSKGLRLSVSEASAST